MSPMTMTDRFAPLVLRVRTAADMMTPNPVSLRAEATLGEAVALLTDRGFSAAPVIDEAGRPLGVLSQSDILIHERESRGQAVPDYYESADLSAEVSPAKAAPMSTLVRDLMTPVVFAVAPEATARQVVEEMLRLNVHRLFVVGGDGVLVGTISTLDVLRHLRD